MSLHEKQEVCPGQGTSAAPGLTDAEAASADASGQTGQGLAADRSPDAPAPTEVATVALTEEWVLVMDQSDAEGRNWFQQMTPIGPMGTWDPAAAARFTSEEEARRSPAYFFPLTFYRPERIGG